MRIIAPPPSGTQSHPVTGAMRALGWWCTLAGCDPTEPPAVPSYEVHIAPILQAHCVRCHERAEPDNGGVALDRYAPARSTRIRSACTALDPDLVEQYAGSLRSSSAEAGEEACARWTVASMPPGAMDHLSRYDQELLARWVATGAAP
jgi:hypothetical protein